jgi:hypothetical protein
LENRIATTVVLQDITIHPVEQQEPFFDATMSARCACAPSPRRIVHAPFPFEGRRRLRPGGDSRPGLRDADSALTAQETVK